MAIESEDDEDNDISTELEKERDALGGGELSDEESGETSGNGTAEWVSSAVRSESRQRGLGKTMRLLPGERLGWWSSRKYDQRRRMRALVNGAVNNARTRILLDTGANVSVISTKLARKLRIRDVPDHGRYMEVQGFTKGKEGTSRRALVKSTLGWERVYKFEMWVMDHSAGVEVVLGTDFMIPAGVRLDLFHATAQLPDEVKIPLVQTQSAADDDFGVGHVVGGPTDVLQIPKWEWESREFRLQRRQPTSDTHEIWIRGTQQLVPTVASFRRGQPDRVRLTNISERLVACPCHLPVVLWVPVGDLP
ncbi:hypothetical protein PF003_g33212 [Phytophthora fragariae]|nr:hypothetical protein PF003_g33212 [Phytophthora fragariae]